MNMDSILASSRSSTEGLGTLLMKSIAQSVSKQVEKPKLFIDMSDGTNGPLKGTISKAQFLNDFKKRGGTFKFTDPKTGNLNAKTTYHEVGGGSCGMHIASAYTLNTMTLTADDPEYELQAVYPVYEKGVVVEIPKTKPFPPITLELASGNTKSGGSTNRKYYRPSALTELFSDEDIDKDYGSYKLNSNSEHFGEFLKYIKETPELDNMLKSISNVSAYGSMFAIMSGYANQEYEYNKKSYTLPGKYIQNINYADLLCGSFKGDTGALLNTYHQLLRMDRNIIPENHPNINTIRKIQDAMSKSMESITNSISAYKNYLNSIEESIKMSPKLVYGTQDLFSNLISEKEEHNYSSSYIRAHAYRRVVVELEKIDLTSENEGLKKEKIDLTSENEELKKEKIDLTSRIDEYDAMIEELNANTEELGNMLEAALNENKNQKKVIDDLHIIINSTNSEKEEQKKEIDALKNKLDTSLSENSKLASENKSTQSELESLLQENSELKLELSSVKLRLDAKTFECVLLTVEVRELDRKNTELLKKMYYINCSKSEFKSLLDKSVPISEFSEYCIGNDPYHEYEYTADNNHSRIIRSHYRILCISPEHVYNLDTRVNVQEMFDSVMADLKINLLRDIRCSPQHAEVAVGLIITVLRNNDTTGIPFLYNIFDDMYKKHNIYHVPSKDEHNKNYLYDWMYYLLSQIYSEFIGCKATSSSKFNKNYPVSTNGMITLQGVINKLFSGSNRISLSEGINHKFNVARTIHHLCRSVGEYEIEGCIDGKLNSKGGNDEDHLSEELLTKRPIADADASRKWDYYPTSHKHSEYYTTIPFVSKDSKRNDVDYNLLDALTAFGKFNMYRGESEYCIIQCFFALRNRTTIQKFLKTWKGLSPYDRIFDPYTCTVQTDKYYNIEFKYGFAEYMMVYAFDFLNERDMNARDIMHEIYPNDGSYKVLIANRKVYNGNTHKVEAHTIINPDEVVVRLLVSYITFMIFSHDNFGVPLFSHRAVNPKTINLYFRGDVNASAEQKWNKNISVTHKIFTTEVIPYVEHVYSCLKSFTEAVPKSNDHLTISRIAEGFWNYCEKRGLEELRSNKVNEQNMDSEKKKLISFSITAKCKKFITPGDIYYRLILGRHASYDINDLIKIDTEKRTVSIKHGSRIGNITPYGPESNSKNEFLKLSALAPYDRTYQRSLYSNFKKTFDMLYELYRIRIEVHKQSVS